MKKAFTVLITSILIIWDSALWLIINEITYYGSWRDVTLNIF